MLLSQRWIACAALAAASVAGPLGAETAAPPVPIRLDPGPAPTRLEGYDPFEGIEKDGRIPTLARPEDLPNPERWRYIPEGRIKPGNLLQRFLVTSFVAPVFFIDEDVGTGFGAAITDIDFRKQRRQEFAGIFLTYTTQGQQNYSVVWQRWLHHLDAAGGGVFQEERSRVRVRMLYRKALTLRFFGFGSRTRDFDETSFTDEGAVIDLGLEHAWPDPGDDFVLSGGLRYELHDLKGGEKSGVPSTSQVFPSLVTRDDDQSLGYIYWGVRWDTRDSQAIPYRGGAVGAEIEAALLQSGGDVGARYNFFANWNLPVPGIFHRGGTPDEENPPTDTLAVNLQVSLSSGELPFYERPALGGSNFHRGFIEGRFRDKAGWIASTEYRMWVLARGFRIPFTRSLRVERAGIAPFYEIGTVAEDGAHFFRSRTRLHHSYGIGFRMTLERIAPFRVDVGFSNEDVIVSAGFGLPF